MRDRFLAFEIGVIIAAVLGSVGMIAVGFHATNLDAGDLAFILAGALLAEGVLAALTLMVWEIETFVVTGQSVTFMMLDFEARTVTVDFWEDLRIKRTVAPFETISAITVSRSHEEAGASEVIAYLHMNQAFEVPEALNSDDCTALIARLEEAMTRSGRSHTIRTATIPLESTAPAASAVWPSVAPQVMATATDAPTATRPRGSHWRLRDRTRNQW